MKKKNGFTLVELLAVIVILSIILTFAIANVSKLKKQQEQKNKENQISSILTAAKNYCAQFTCNSSVEVKKLIEEQFLTLDSSMSSYEGKYVSISPCGTSPLKRYFLFSDAGNTYDDCGCETKQDSKVAIPFCTKGNGEYE